MSIERVFVAGAGLMGHGIAQVHAAIERRVILYEPDLARADAGRARIAGNLDRAVAKGRLTDDERSATLDRIEATDDLARAADADLVIEAVFEDADVKRRLWADLDRHAPGDAIFATNTSSISIDLLAAAVSAERRARFVGMHFFSPVPVMPLIELIRSSDTDDGTEAAIRALAAEMGKQVIVSADRPGFIVNRVLMPLLAEAMRAYEEGLGTADDIDTGAKVGLNHPMGPLELADFIGLDVCLGILRVLHEGLGGEQFRPPRVLEELVTVGHLGQKTGRGFHTYPR
ncbi:MAG TPA: 3-hydroxyacyl-CoA dehydrogenase NAD-binding domain-containing protein [Candidatus Limnocylindrales bacterium]|nr:3-hydroxyacyl-CoA dehydrogenase NAD-binding domain-containing protein [Candidatus Limnocylindrales bacterium]